MLADVDTREEREIPSIVIDLLCILQWQEQNTLGLVEKRFLLPLK